MKRSLVAALVGAVILFAWQFLSWTVLPFHQEAYRYTPNEQAILSHLSSNLPEDGQYMIPGHKPGTSQEEQAKVWESNAGKPWAIVTYFRAYDNDMSGQMIRGFLICLVSVWIVSWLVKGINGFANILGRVLVIAFLLWFFTWYLQHNWFHTPWAVLKGELIDYLVGWGLVGLWLGWWLNRQTRRV